ncbi:MAG: amylo-alpha-1,6-glucosidase [Chloroflexi bacterium]|nr:MAG: amylo-alpha-1,6-glucosidase [Chloroflexota bacterium]TME17665.1 MAG: amylo-alpha-1,6-glucosidase [Chloroflexota bacterium]TME19241.1 MAG: amylo-alpha-1,6-glucosidase [Chloroflexota bacterium]
MLEDRVILKENRVFAMSDENGDIPINNQFGFGLYHLDTRFLSGFEVRLGDSVPILLSSSVDRAYVATFQLVNPAIRGLDGKPVARQTLSLRRTRFLHEGLHERIGILNCNPGQVEFTLDLAFKADFQDIFGVRGYRFEQPLGEADPVEVTDFGFRFGYNGADGIRRQTEVVFNCPRTKISDDGRVSFNVSLQRQQAFILVVDILPLVGGRGPRVDFDFESALSSLEGSYRRWNETCTGLGTDNEILNAGLLWRSREDLRILIDQMPTGPFPTAGIPWYAVPFGRDALITSVQTLALNPDLGRGTLLYLAEHQGKAIDPQREEEPGKILHEIRFGEVANLKLIPHTPYYGSVDATPLFLVLLVELLNWTGDLDLLTDLMPNVFAALAWCDEYADADRDGFLEYSQHSSLPGVRNQGWKDSFDSLTHDDGSLAPLPAALCEVQGYAYQAKKGLAAIFRRLGRQGEADRLETQAEELRRRFNDRFWMPEKQFYAQALDAEKRQVMAISSNPGHLLWSGVVDTANAPAVVSELMSPQMYSGWGIRTLSSDAINYNPMSYHNGTVWPHDNSIIAAGLRRYGFRKEAELVARAVLEAGMRFQDSRLPELYCGFPRDLRFNSRPGEYLVSCNPQAWGAGSVFQFLAVLLGLEADAFGSRLRIDPVDTPLYERLHVAGMTIGEERIDFTVDRTRGKPRVKVRRRPKKVELELPT